MIIASVVIAFLLIVIGFIVALVMVSGDYAAYDKEQAARRAHLLARHTKVSTAKLARVQVKTGEAQ